MRPSINHGVWQIWPEHRIAFNCHNGNAFRWHWSGDVVSGWGINVPAAWMVDQLAEWLRWAYSAPREGVK